MTKWQQRAVRRLKTYEGQTVISNIYEKMNYIDFQFPLSLLIAGRQYKGQTIHEKKIEKFV